MANPDNASRKIRRTWKTFIVINHSSQVLPVRGSESVYAIRSNENAVILLTYWTVFRADTLHTGVIRGRSLLLCFALVSCAAVVPKSVPDEN